MSHRKGVCVDCGKPTSYKAYKRCLSCARKGERNPNWGRLKDDVSPDAGRQRARHRFELGLCVKCGVPSDDRHHINGNTLDNRPENILTLCRACHMAADGRLDRLIERNRKGRKYKDNAEKFRALRARRRAEGRPIRKKKKSCKTSQQNNR